MDRGLRLCRWAVLTSSWGVLTSLCGVQHCGVSGPRHHGVSDVIRQSPDIIVGCPGPRHRAVYVRCPNVMVWCPTSSWRFPWP